MKITTKEPSVGRKASLRYILFLIFIHVVLLTTLTGCGMKGPLVPPETSESFSEIGLQIANVRMPSLYKK